jgi:hypothetical protein
MKAQTAEHRKLLGPVTPGDRRKICLLQAADLLVWQATKFVKRRANGFRKPRGDFIELVKDRHTFVYVDATAKYYSTYRDDWPHIVNDHLDGWIKAMFHLPDSWEPHLHTASIHIRYSVDFGPDLSPTPPKLGAK